MRALQQMPEAVPAQTLVLKAPLSGRLMPIERVPDPVFAQKIVGGFTPRVRAGDRYAAEMHGQLASSRPA